MPFTFGENWKASYCGSSKCARPYIGISTSLAPEGEFIDLSGATGVSFKIKSRSVPLKVIFKVHTYDIEMDSTFAFYQDTVIASTSWETKNILFSELTQPSWANSSSYREFDQSKVTQFAWELLEENNSSVTSDTLDLDDIYINDFTYATPDLPLLIDDFEKGIAGNKIGTYWYFVDDSDSLGNSKVNNAGPENQFLGSYTSGNSSLYAGVMDFTIGNSYAYPSAGMKFNFDNANSPINLTGAKAVQFDIKGSKAMSVKFSVNQSTITDYDYYSKKIEVWPVWRTVTVYLFTGDHGINQESGWGVDKPFEINKITALEWLYRKQDNPGSSSSGIVYIDNVKILGNPVGLHEPFPPLWKSPEWKSEDNILSPVISWYKPNVVGTYSLQVATTPDFANPLLNLTSHPDTAYTASGLSYGTTYYCRVKVTTASDTSRWSSNNIFTTLFQTPPPPSLVSPAQNATAVPVSTLLSWNKALGAKKYRLQVSSSDAFLTTILDSGSITDTPFALSSLANGTSYYWRVNATNTSGTVNGQSPEV